MASFSASASLFSRSASASTNVRHEEKEEEEGCAVVEINESNADTARKARSSHAFFASSSSVSSVFVGTFVVVLLLLGCTMLLFGASYQSYLTTSTSTSLTSSSSSASVALRRILPQQEHVQQDSTATATASTLDDDYGLGAYYVPALEYRIKAISQYMHYVPAHPYCDNAVSQGELEPSTTWDWWQPPRTNPGTQDTANDDASYQQHRGLRKQVGRATVIATAIHDDDPRPQQQNTPHRLLIGIGGGYDERNSRLMERAHWSARMYAASNTETVEVTVVQYHGTDFTPHGCKAPPHYATLNKIQILLTALSPSAEDSTTNESYDTVLLLDSDTMLYDMDFDVTQLLVSDNDNGNTFAVAGRRPSSSSERDEKAWWKIDSSMTLWNLHHPATLSIAQDWYQWSKNAIIRDTYVSATKYLHKSLAHHHDEGHAPALSGASSSTNVPQQRLVKILTHHEFDDAQDGTLVKQFDGGAHHHKTSTVVRSMDNVAKQLCAQHVDVCTDDRIVGRGYQPPQ